MQTLVPLAVTKIPARTRDEAYKWTYAHFNVGMHIVQCFHDDDCPALKTHRDADCVAPCQPDWYLLSFVDDGKAGVQWN